jgi:hypothetical protein
LPAFRLDYYPFSNEGFLRSLLVVFLFTLASRAVSPVDQPPVAVLKAILTSREASLLVTFDISVPKAQQELNLIP